MMVGRIIMPSRMAADRMVAPEEMSAPKNLAISSTVGAMTTMPKKPYTMDGIPASSSVQGFKMP